MTRDKAIQDRNFRIIKSRRQPVNSHVALIVLLLAMSVLLAACGENVQANRNQEPGQILSLPGTSPAPTDTPEPTLINPPLPTTSAASATGQAIDYHPIIWFSASTLPVGSSLTVGGSGYPANTPLNVTLSFENGRHQDIFPAPLSNEQGKFVTAVLLDQSPDGTPLKPGQVTIIVSNFDQSVSAGAAVTLTEAVAATLTKTPAITTLPATTLAPTKIPATPTSRPPTAVADQNQTAQGKWIDVNLTKQRLQAYEGNNVIFSTLISSGVARHPTVTGNFNVYIKLQKQTMIGGRGSEAYNLPDVPYVMYFYQDYGIHGTYWHHNFGHVMSHGCVNTPTDSARFLFNWAPLGTPVNVHY